MGARTWGRSGGVKDITSDIAHLDHITRRAPHLLGYCGHSAMGTWGSGDMGDMGACP